MPEICACNHEGPHAYAFECLQPQCRVHGRRLSEIAHPCFSTECPLLITKANIKMDDIFSTLESTATLRNHHTVPGQIVVGFSPLNYTSFSKLQFRLVLSWCPLIWQGRHNARQHLPLPSYIRKTCSLYVHTSVALLHIEVHYLQQ